MRARIYINYDFQARSRLISNRVDISRRSEHVQYQSKDFGAQCIDKDPSVDYRYVILKFLFDLDPEVTPTVQTIESDSRPGE